MASRVQLMKQKGLISPPKWLPQNVHYEVISGSVSYGASSDTSDMDIVGFCIPPKEDIFPHLRGEIPGFGTQKQRFDVWQQHHVMDKEVNQEYDFTVYSIVKYFQLLMENNPNMLDSIFVPHRCVLFCSPVAQMVRDNRKMFLHKGSYHKFRGYMFSQLHKIEQKTNSSNPKRAAVIAEHGFDLKFASHSVRLGLEAEQILIEHDLDIERNREVLKSIRRGEWSIERIKEFCSQKERHLDDLYQKSTLQHSPDEEAIKELLMNCLEQHYGSLDQAVKREVPVERMISELKAVLERYER
jgi:predicted nucleotidyltransferase